MKKASILLFITGLGILYGLSWLFPVPSVSPVRVENETEETTDSNTGISASFTAGKFIFPYYRHPLDEKPTWIFRGLKGQVIRKKKDQILVQNPRIKHYPPSQTDASKSDTSAPEIEEVTITGEHGRKQPGNVAFLKKNVQVLTSKGGELTTRQLFADFDNDRLYTRSNHEIEMDRPGLYLEGTGFSGNSRLSQYTLRKNVYLRLSTSRLRSLSKNETNQSPADKDPYFITAEGPLNARLINETDKKRTWKLSVSRNVFLYQMQDAGSLRQSSEQLHLTLIEQKVDPTKNAPKTPKKNNESNLKISSYDAIGQVHIDDHGTEIWSDRVQMNRTNQKTVYHLKGDSQKINLKEQTSHHSKPRSPNASAKRQQQTPPGTTSIRVSGTGQLERPHPALDSDETQTKPLGSAHFEGRVFVHRNKTRLQSNSLSITFSEASQKPKRNVNSRSSSSNSPVQIHVLDARGNALFLNENIAASGNQITWTPPEKKINIHSNRKSIISNLHNRIQGQEIGIDRATSSLTAKRNVHTTFSTKRNRGFQLFGLSESSGSDSNSGDRPTKPGTNRSRKWHLDADQLSFNLHPESNQLRRLHATGNVEISSNQVNGYGNKFAFRRSESTAVLQGNKRKARLHQNHHRAFADSFRFRLDHKNVIIKGQKRLRMEKRNNRSTPEENKSDNSSNQWKGPFELISGSPTIIHRTSGRLRIMGPTRVLKPGGHMRTQRVNVRFNPQSNEIQTVRLNGNVFITERAGTALGDLAKWNAQNDRLILRGQPSATVNRNGRTARYEIITLWNDWTSLRGKNYKWRSPGSLKEQK